MLLLMNNQVQFILFYFILFIYLLFFFVICAAPDFVVQLINFLCLVLFSVVIHKRRAKKLVGKIIKYKLDSLSKMQFDIFNAKDI